METKTLNLPILKIGRRSNITGRIYPYEVIKEAVAEYRTLVDNGLAVGQLGHSDGFDAQMSEITHKITKLGFKHPKTPRKLKKRLKKMGKWDSHLDLWAEAEMLQTPKSFQCIPILDRLRLAPKGAGSISQDGITVETYKLCSIDLLPPTD